jgi:acetylornithine deacetylase/succinyl-diaminopimelate desuccinylase-like protein
MTERGYVSIRWTGISVAAILGAAFGMIGQALPMPWAVEHNIDATSSTSHAAIALLIRRVEDLERGGGTTVIARETIARFEAHAAALERLDRNQEEIRAEVRRLADGLAQLRETVAELRGRAAPAKRSEATPPLKERPPLPAHMPTPPGVGG